MTKKSFFIMSIAILTVIAVFYFTYQTNSVLSSINPKFTVDKRAF